MAAAVIEPPDRSERWSRPARILHWLVAALVPVQLWLGWTADGTTDRTESFRLISTHFQIGGLLFILMVLRLTWRVFRGRPARLFPEPTWRRMAAAGVHALLYALLLIMPLSGYVIWIWMGAPRTLLGLIELPQLFEPPADDESSRALAWYIHHYSAYLLAGLALLHVAAALWHELVRRDGTISRRMT